MKIPRSHPRYKSLIQRQLLINGLRDGFVTEAGLIAHGRGEAFDYLLGERTTEEGEIAERVAIAMLLLSKNPVISVNGNTVALVPRGIVELADITNSKIEVNLFHGSREREELIKKILRENGAKEVLISGEKYKLIPGLDSERARVNPDGIWISDTVLVPLEDGDRTESLVRMRKNVISIDLNPLSRTSQYATISIVDNIVRAIPNMIEFAKEMKNCDKEELNSIVSKFDNKKNLEKIIRRIRTEF
ncbi:MAG: hypothetical protein DRO94_02605 [Candidatus Altiarchaeales archaeon]|nr:MAG: hypothetical protein DRO94_02605 [Candidatus Altiarchaeales archaeon]